jgi:hypothetical protein
LITRVTYTKCKNQNKIIQSEEGTSAEDRGGGDDDGGWWMWMATEETMKTVEIFI